MITLVALHAMLTRIHAPDSARCPGSQYGVLDNIAPRPHPDVLSEGRLDEEGSNVGTIYLASNDKLYIVAYKTMRAPRQRYFHAIAGRFPYSPMVLLRVAIPDGMNVTPCS